METFEKNNVILKIFKGVRISIAFTLICLTIFSALLTYTNLSESLIQPVVISVTGISILVGSFFATRKVEKNGIIKINLPNFDDEPDIRDILATLQHECFHAYQFNCRRGTMPIETVRNRAMMAAYSYGHNQYISSKNDYESYYEQGYESSARSFSAQLARATDIIITEAIKQAMEGDANE